MYATFALLAAAAVTPAVASARDTGAFDPLTATYRIKNDDYCIRTGWGIAARDTGRAVRAGECRTADDWRHRGLTFDPVTTAQSAAARDSRIAAR